MELQGGSRGQSRLGLKGGKCCYNRNDDRVCSGVWMHSRIPLAALGGNGDIS